MKFILICVIFLGIYSCGGESGESGTTTDESQQNTNVDESAATKLNLTYSFKIQIADKNGINAPYIFPKNYTAPLLISDTGGVTIKARDFPKMVLRICPEGSTKTCDIYVDSSDDDLGDGLDLVLDLCGFNKIHSECGPTDGTLFSGTITSDGSLNIPAIAVRLRVFSLDGGPNGTTASATAGGFISDLPRIIVSIKTNPDVAINGLKASGSKINGQNITLVGSGIIPSNMPELGSAAYVISIDGSFDSPPLDLLN